MKVKVVSVLICFLVITSLFLGYSHSVLGAAGGINFSILKPKVNQVINGDRIDIVISKPESTYQIDKVIASIGKKTTNLNYSANTGNSKPGWTGQIDLDSLDRGVKNLQIDVYDIKGNHATKTTSFTHSGNPILDISSPRNGEFFSHNEVPIKINAHDAAGEKTHIKVYIGFYEEDSTLIAEGDNKIDKIAKLRVMGEPGILRIEAKNQSGSTYTEERFIHFDYGKTFTPIDYVPGDIMDFDGQRVLYKNNQDVYLKNIDTGLLEKVYYDKSSSPNLGYLTKSGAILSVNDYNYHGSVFEYANGKTTELGSITNGEYLKVKGNYAVWNDNDSLFLRDTENGQTTKIVSNKGYYSYDLSEKGEVVYSTSSDDKVFEYKQGILKPLLGDSTDSYSFPRRDGKYTVFIKNHHNQSELVLFDGTKEEVITTSPGYSYLVKNGRVAFTKDVNGTNQVFIWDHAKVHQLSYFGRSSSISSLNDSGDVIFDGYYVPYSQGVTATKQIYHTGLNIKWLDSKLYGFIGGSILKAGAITYEQTPPALPKIKTVGEFDRYVTGTAEDGSRITVKIGDVLVGSAVSFHGTFAAKIPKQKPGTVLKVIAMDDWGNESKESKVTVKDRRPPHSPWVSSISNRDTKIKGKAYEADVVVTAKVGKKAIGSGKAAKDGSYSFKIKKQKAGTKIAITAKDHDGNVSGAVVKIVKDKIPPASPKVKSASNKDKRVKGTTEANAVVAVKAGKKTIGKGKADRHGKFTVKISKQRVGTKLTVYASDKAGNVSKGRKVTLK